MATVIRLRRGGRTHAPHYRVVVMDSRSRARGPVLDQVGIYHPYGKTDTPVDIDEKKALHWLWMGAQPTDTVRNLLSKTGVMKAFGAGVRPEDIQEAPAEPSLAAPETATPRQAPAPTATAEAVVQASADAADSSEPQSESQSEEQEAEA